MNDDKLYKILVDKMHEVSLVPPQTVGPLTPLYKRLVPQLKYSPWKSAIVFSTVISFALYYVFGSVVLKLVSLLQYGF